MKASFTLAVVLATVAVSVAAAERQSYRDYIAERPEVKERDHFKSFFPTDRDDGESFNDHISQMQGKDDKTFEDEYKAKKSDLRDFADVHRSALNDYKAKFPEASAKGSVPAAKSASRWGALDPRQYYPFASKAAAADVDADADADTAAADKADADVPAEMPKSGEDYLQDMKARKAQRVRIQREAARNRVDTSDDKNFSLNRLYQDEADPFKKPREPKRAPKPRLTPESAPFSRYMNQMVHDESKGDDADKATYNPESYFGGVRSDIGQDDFDKEVQTKNKHFRIVHEKAIGDYYGPKETEADRLRDQEKEAVEALLEDKTELDEGLDSFGLEGLFHEEDAKAPKNIVKADEQPRKRLTSSAAKASGAIMAVGISALAAAFMVL